MCTEIKYINNRTLHWSPDVDALRFGVPCNHCVECQNALRNDWFVRCYYEYHNCASHGWPVLFLTLTLNKEHLPMFHNIPTFSKVQIQRFLKRLRTSLPKGVKFRYMVVCEFGDERHRPHYHILIFLLCDFNPYLFRRYVDSAWQQGFIKEGKFGLTVRDSRGIEYVTKYCVKDSSFVDEYRPKIAQHIIHRWERVIRLFTLQYGKVEVSFDEHGCLHSSCSRSVKLHEYAFELFSWIVNRMRKQLNSLLPFHLQSLGLGSSLLHQPVNFDDEFVSIQLANGCTPKYPLPRYIKRKLWYDMEVSETTGKKTLYVLNDAGKTHYKAMVPKRISSFVIELETAFKNINLLDDGAVRQVNYLLNTKFRSLDDLKQFFYSCESMNKTYLSIYKNVYRNRVMPFAVPEDDFQAVMDSCFDYAERCIDKCRCYDFGQLNVSHGVSSSSFDKYLWNNYPPFQSWEFFLQVFEVCDFYVRTQVSDSKKIQEKLHQRVRLMFK